MIKMLLIILSFSLITGCTINLSKDNNDDDSLEINEEIEEEKEFVEDVTSIGIKSDLANPLKVGQYGVASKYNALLEEYKDVDVCITKIYDNPDEIIADYNRDHPEDLIEKKEGFKFVVLDYEVVFFDFETESFGTDVELNIEVVDSSNNSFIVNDVKQFISINVLSSDQGIVNEEKGNVKIAFAIPESIVNYLVKFGTSDYTIAYYKI